MQKKFPSISLIVTTYNWPSALSCVLQAIAKQTYCDFEVIIADDGSQLETSHCIRQYIENFPVSLQHVWQKDQGFRAAMIRNRAILKSKNEYIVFLDGDCLPSIDFIENHAKLAQQGWFVFGNRMLLSQAFTQKMVLKKLPIITWGLMRWFIVWLQRDTNRCFFPNPFLGVYLRKMQPQRWKGVQTCNLGVWRKDLLAVNGFNETYVGWGYEDTDLILRLHNNHIKSYNGKGIVKVIHLWHKENDRKLMSDNLKKLHATMSENLVFAEKGLSQYCHED